MIASELLYGSYGPASFGALMPLKQDWPRADTKSLVRRKLSPRQDLNKVSAGPCIQLDRNMRDE